MTLSKIHSMCSADARDDVATSQLFVGSTIKIEGDHLPASSDGVIADIHVSAFQTSIDDLLTAGRYVALFAASRSTMTDEFLQIEGTFLCPLSDAQGDQRRQFGRSRRAERRSASPRFPPARRTRTTLLAQVENKRYPQQSHDRQPKSRRLVWRIARQSPRRCGESSLGRRDRSRQNFADSKNDDISCEWSR